MYICIALRNSQTIDRTVALVNAGAAEGMEGIEFTGEQLAGQYAEQAAHEAGFSVDEAAVEAHLDFLVEAGGQFDYSAATKHALAIAAARSLGQCIEG